MIKNPTTKKEFIGLIKNIRSVNDNKNPFSLVFQGDLNDPDIRGMRIRVDQHPSNNNAISINALLKNHPVQDQAIYSKDESELTFLNNLVSYKLTAFQIGGQTTIELNQDIINPKISSNFTDENTRLFTPVVELLNATKNVTILSTFKNDMDLETGVPVTDMNITFKGLPEKTSISEEKIKQIIDFISQ